MATLVPGMPPVRLARILPLLVVLVAASPAVAAPSVKGEWWTQDRTARIRIAPCPDRPDRLCGWLVWIAEPLNASGEPWQDRNHPEEGLRERQVLGLRLLDGFRLTDDGRFVDGTVYNPQDGRTYASEFRLAGPDTLEVSGCVWIFCRSRTLERFQTSTRHAAGGARPALAPDVGRDPQAAPPGD